MPTFADLGVHTLINARGAYTVLGGSLMLPEVRAAMDLAARSFVDLEELMEAAGRRIALCMGAPHALVTNGAAAGLCQTVAAAIAGTDEHKMEVRKRSFWCHLILNSDRVAKTGSGHTCSENSTKTTAVSRSFCRSRTPTQPRR